MINACEKLSVVKVEAGGSVSIKLQTVLRRNPGFSIFISVHQTLNGDDEIPLKTLLLRKFLC
jgi:hypothetical protein